jgi:hypothetical protein
VQPVMSSASISRRGHQCGMSYVRDTHVLERMFAAAMDGLMNVCKCLDLFSLYTCSFGWTA